MPRRGKDHSCSTTHAGVIGDGGGSPVSGGSRNGMGGVGCRSSNCARVAAEGSATPTSRSAAAALDHKPSRAHSSARSARAAAAASVERRAAVVRDARVASWNRAARSPRSHRSRRDSVNLATCPRCRRPPRPDGGKQSRHLESICNSTTEARVFACSTWPRARRSARAHRTRAFRGTCLSVGTGAACTTESGGRSPKAPSAWAGQAAAAARRAGQQRRQH